MSNYTIEQALDFRQKIFDRLPSLETDGQCGIPNQRFWDFYREKKTFFSQRVSMSEKTKTRGIFLLAHSRIDTKRLANRFRPGRRTTRPNALTVARDAI